jgi:hypothetical protein
MYPEEPFSCSCVCEREREGGRRDMRWVREEGRRERRGEIRTKRERDPCDLLPAITSLR